MTGGSALSIIVLWLLFSDVSSDGEGGGTGVRGSRVSVTHQASGIYLIGQRLCCCQALCQTLVIHQEINRENLPSSSRYLPLSSSFLRTCTQQSDTSPKHPKC